MPRASIRNRRREQNLAAHDMESGQGFNPEKARNNYKPMLRDVGVREMLWINMKSYGLVCVCVYVLHLLSQSHLSLCTLFVLADSSSSHSLGLL